MNLSRIALSALLLSNVSYAGITAIVDSGIDVNHPDLQNRLWQNPDEILNNADDDLNGIVDDINGFNSLDHNGILLNEKFIPLLKDQEVMAFYDFISELTLKSLEPGYEMDDATKKKIMDNKELYELAGLVGSFAHGTNVAGIAAIGNDAEIMGIKLIPADPTDYVDQAAEEQNVKQLRKKKGLRDKLISKLLSYVAKLQAEEMTPIAEYLRDHKVSVANGSYGTGYPQALEVAKSMLGKVYLLPPKKNKIERVAEKFLVELNNQQKEKYIDIAPNTLFVFAAGNDGLNNDVYNTAPNNIVSDNIISVAATDGTKALARFSNYGLKTVDVAAPGVNSNSTAPGGGYISMSGTSQAAPYVSNVASRIVSINDQLSPKEIKSIIVGTVQKYDFLKNFVKSSGIVNVARAVKAAELSKTLPLETAIAKANREVTEMEIIDLY